MNNKYIIFMTIFLFILILIYNIITDTTIKRNIESFNISSKNNDSMCSRFSSLPINDRYYKMNDVCNKYTKNTCNVVDCCVWKNNEECVVGNEEGPTWPEQNKKTEYYSWKNTCYGNCPR